MKIFAKKDKRSKLEKEIDEVVLMMSTLAPEAEEYQKMAEVLDKLMKANSYKTSKPGIDPNTVLLIVGNILGILLVLNYEQLHCVTSKALGMIQKGRV